MFTNLKVGRFGRPVAAAILVCGLCLPLASTTSVSAQAESFPIANLDTSFIETVKFETLPNIDRGLDDLAVRVATTEFIRGMRESDAATVWKFASEEDQEAFASKDAVLKAFSETFPVLTETQSATFANVVRQGDTPMVTLLLRDKSGNAFKATIGLWLDDANDWKVVSCDITPVDGRVA